MDDHVGTHGIGFMDCLDVWYPAIVGQLFDLLNVGVGNVGHGLFYFIVCNMPEGFDIGRLELFRGQFALSASGLLLFFFFNWIFSVKYENWDDIVVAKHDE